MSIVLRLAALALGVGLLGAAPAAVAQAQLQRVMLLLQGVRPPPGSPRAIPRYLSEMGHVEGQTIVFEGRWSEGQPERFPALAAELVALKPDVIVADSTPAVLAAKAATSSIPIVMFNVTDPVATGLVRSLSHPGGNVTGVADLGVEMAVHGLDLIHSVVPAASRIAVLMADNPAQLVQLRELQRAAKTARLTLVPIVARSTDELGAAFAAMARSKVGALIALGGAPGNTVAQLRTIAELAMRARLPMLSQAREAPPVGALMAYFPASQLKQVAMYVDRILRGSAAGDLPVQQPTEFGLVINTTVAKALGLSIPESVLVRATGLVE
jgi:putative ABC transport system substrate-binding protein